MDGQLILLLLVIALGLGFEFVNGFHDAANAIATIVATRVLSPRVAVLMAGGLNLLGALSGTAVATTVGKGLVDSAAITLGTVAVALLAAIVWDLATWYFGLPSSSSHALLFGTMGAAVATAGPGVIIPQGLATVSLGIVYSPVIGMVGGALIMLIIIWVFRRTHADTISKIFGRAQLLSSAYMAFSHGSNDGQKTMGILSLALLTASAPGTPFQVPFWVIVACATAMGCGTAMGGWRIIKTVGFGMVQLRPVNGFAAETAAGTVIEVATRLGVPISTTHAISGAIIGVGALRGAKRVRWGAVAEIVTAWVLTIPGCFAIGWVLMMAVQRVFGAI
ncbi:MAG: inorganic phosphate transporter, PiT family [Chloroflexota bacterium]|jgi:PiT family inorganic phosphate transporter|nr:inorganic phosphate transporter, PiT family [Chloroflexota bacterium]